MAGHPHADHAHAVPGDCLDNMTLAADEGIRADRRVPLAGLQGAGQSAGGIPHADPGAHAGDGGGGGVARRSFDERADEAERGQEGRDDGAREEVVVDPVEQRSMDLTHDERDHQQRQTDAADDKECGQHGPPVPT